MSCIVPSGCVSLVRLPVHATSVLRSTLTLCMRTTWLDLLIDIMPESTAVSLSIRFLNPRFSHGFKLCASDSLALIAYSCVFPALYCFDAALHSARGVTDFTHPVCFSSPSAATKRYSFVLASLYFPNLCANIIILPRFCTASTGTVRKSVFQPHTSLIPITSRTPSPRASRTSRRVAPQEIRTETSICASICAVVALMYTAQAFSTPRRSHYLYLTRICIPGLDDAYPSSFNTHECTAERGEPVSTRSRRYANSATGGWVGLRRAPPLARRPLATCRYLPMVRWNPEARGGLVYGW